MSTERKPGSRGVKEAFGHERVNLTPLIGTEPGYTPEAEIQGHDQDRLPSAVIQEAEAAQVRSTVEQRRQAVA